MDTLNYYLDDIADYLTANNVNNVTVDFYQPEITGQVCLASTGGVSQPDQCVKQVEFQVLVTSNRTNRTYARLISEQIYNLLHNKQGQLVAGEQANKFLKIIAINTPYYLGVNSKGLTEFTTLYKSNISYHSYNNIFNN